MLLVWKNKNYHHFVMDKSSVQWHWWWHTTSFNKPNCIYHLDNHFFICCFLNFMLPGWLLIGWCRWHSFIVLFINCLGVWWPFWLQLKIFFERPVIIKTSEWGIPLHEKSLAGLVIIFLILAWFHWYDAFDSHKFRVDGRNFLEMS